MGTAHHVNVCTELNNKSTHAAQWGLMLRQLPSRYATEGKPSNWSKQGTSEGRKSGAGGKNVEKAPLNAAKWALGASKL